MVHPKLRFKSRKSLMGSCEQWRSCSFYGFKAPCHGLSQFGLLTWKSCQSSQSVPSLSKAFHKRDDPTSQDTEQGKATSGLDLYGVIRDRGGSLQALRHRLVFFPYSSPLPEREYINKGKLHQEFNQSFRQKGWKSVHVC